MPKPKITIIVKGVVLFYHKNGAAKFIFPIDADCHRISFSYKKGGENESSVEYLAQAGRIINITAQNANSTSGVGDGIDKFIDLTADYSHIDGIKLKNGWRNNAVEMTIENAQLSLGNLSERTFILLENNIIKKKADKIGDSINAEIELEADGKVIVGYKTENQDVIVLESDAGSSYTLTFDNDCEMLPPTARNDFEMFYDLIEDVKDSNRQFKLVGLKPTSQYIDATEGDAVDETVFIEPFNENAEGDFPCKPSWISDPSDPSFS
ncbi:hypothetical protein BH24ACI2_BH24ACI2_05530 [soil metagenome]|jgi:hypothetical protein|nr:hypothetical protein [Acidobacteriota bacterium]